MSWRLTFWVSVFQRSFESLISRCKTRHGSAGFGDDGFASGAETSAVFLCVPRIKFFRGK
jgi:hypothetical protein